MVAWLLFGALAVPTLTTSLSWQVVAYAVLSLTIIRMVPVALCLLGSRMDWPTVAFVGWFGPRGLASVVFALITLEDMRSAGRGRWIRRSSGPSPTSPVPTPTRTSVTTKPWPKPWTLAGSLHRPA
jgi:NhaP-type Na+/H+ or K+/H+ antiporter